MCQHIKLPDGTQIIVCGLRQKVQLDPEKFNCKNCGKPAAFLCDWKMPGRKTCDESMCPKCALHVAEGKHLCPTHAKAWDEWKRERGIMTQEGLFNDTTATNA